MSIAQPTRRFEMVAVSQPKARSVDVSSFALGVRSTQPGAAYVVGTDGPAHKSVEKLYFTASEKEFEIDLVSKTLTIADAEKLRVTIYPIDISAMQGSIIEHGEIFTIVLADDARTERPVRVGRWVAATAPEYKRDTLPSYVTNSEGIAVSISETVQEAERLGTVKLQTFHTTAPTNTRVTHAAQVQVDQATSSSTEKHVEPSVIDLREEPVIDLTHQGYPDGAVEPDGSLAVIVPNPTNGARYWGREWEEDLAEEHELTLLLLRNHGFRVVIMEMENGKSATVALNDPKELPVLSITTHPGKPPVERYLTADTWNERFGPGKPMHFGIDSTLDGDDIEGRRDLATPPITRITATAHSVRGSVDPRYKVSEALARHRKLIATHTAEQHQTLVRSV